MDEWLKEVVKPFEDVEVYELLVTLSNSPVLLKSLNGEKAMAGAFLLFVLWDQKHWDPSSTKKLQRNAS